MSSLWHDAREWGIEGKGWAETPRDYDRLPAKAEKLLPELWEMSRHPTGLSVSFETDAPDIYARWRLRSQQLDEPNMSRAAFSGLDLYAADKGAWRWTAVAQNFENRSPRVQLLAARPAEMRAFRVYLPLRNPVSKLEIGLPRGSKVRAIPPRATKPIVYYGSSIVHGAYASRPGMVFPSMLGRWLNRPVVNLGFSGQAKMHEAMSQLLTEIEAGIFVIDALPNMDLALIKERAEPFLRRLCQGRPRTPVVLVEDFPLTNAWLYPRSLKDHREKWKALRRIFQKLRSEGVGNLHYVEGKHSIGDDQEGTLDGVHPNDLGYERLAEHLFPVLRWILARQ
jgi:hypothetical protein